MVIKSELYRILKSRKSLVFITLIILIPFIDLALNINQTFGEYFNHKELYPNGFPGYFIKHPSLAAFLSATSHSHFPQMILKWILPLYLLLVYCDFYIQEKNLGYNNILYTKVSRKKLISSQFIVSFLVPFVVSLFSLTLNYIAANIIFAGAGGSDINALLQGAPQKLDLLRLSVAHPMITYCVYIVAFAFIAGCCGMMCKAISFLVPYYILVYPFAFILWYVQIAYHYSISNIMQPFIEYGFDYIIPAAEIFLIIVIITVAAAFIRKVRFDEY